MTLVVAIPSSDGIAFASDSQATIGQVKRPGLTKIFKIGPHVLYGFAGQLSVMQKVNERLKTILTPVDIRKSCSKIENAVWEGFREVYNSDIRSQIASTNTNDLINNYSTNFIFVQAKPKPEILTVFGHGGSQWSTDTPVAIGSGEIFALAVFGKYNQIPLNIEQAKLLAYKTVNEAISNATFGLCHPIDVWVTNNDGTHQLQGEELTALQDADRVLRAGELSLMTTYAPVS